MAGPLSLKIADPDRAVGIKTEDYVEGIDHGGSRSDNRSADDGHLALIHVAAPDGKAAIDHCGNAEHEAEHHDDGQAVADAGFEVGGIESRPLGKGRDGVEREQGRDGQEQTMAFQMSVQVSDMFFHSCVVLFRSWAGLPPNHPRIISRPRIRVVRESHKMKTAFRHDERA